MTTFYQFTENNNKGLFNCPPLNGYIYNNVFEPVFFNTLKNNIDNILKYSNKNTFFTHNTIFNINGEERKIISHKQNAREQNVIFDLTFLPEWYYQTNDTMKEWSNQKIKETVSPIFQKCLQKIESLPPISINKDDWIATRCHINYLSYNKCLSLHFDGNPIHFNISQYLARMYSFTFYLYDHIEGLGGELWTVNGFVYKPKSNSAIIINGNQVLHGVTTNMNQNPRLAFTVRMIHKDDLFLPGDPSKYLYDVSSIAA